MLENENGRMPVQDTSQQSFRKRTRNDRELLKTLQQEEENHRFYESFALMQKTGVYDAIKEAVTILEEQGYSDVVVEYGIPSVALRAFTMTIRWDREVRQGQGQLKAPVSRGIRVCIPKDHLNSLHLENTQDMQRQDVGDWYSFSKKPIQWSNKKPKSFWSNLLAEEFQSIIPDTDQFHDFGENGSVSGVKSRRLYPELQK